MDDSQGSYEIIQARAQEIMRVEIDSAIATARQYPRDLERALKNIDAMALRNDETAERCFYTLPGRWDKKKGEQSPPIQGPSIRLLEIFVGQWGNIRTGARIANIDHVNKILTVHAYAHDLESNSRIDEEVSRRFYGGEDGLNNAIGAARSIGIRGAVKRLIGPFVEETYEKCKTAVANSGDPKEQFERALKWFTEQGATAEQVYRFSGVDKPENAARVQVMRLRGLATAIKEGFTTISLAFAPPPEQTGEGTISDEDFHAAETQPAGFEKATPETSPQPEKKASGKGKGKAEPEADKNRHDELVKLLKKTIEMHKPGADLLNELAPLGIDALEDAGIQRVIEQLEAYGKTQK